MARISGTSRGGGNSRGGNDIDRGQRRKLHLRLEAKPFASLGLTWIREEMERVERFSASGKGNKMN